MALALDYNMDRIKDALSKVNRAPRGTNLDIIDAFIKSGRDAAIVGLKEGKRNIPGARNKATSLRKVIRKNGLQDEVTVILCVDEVLLVRKDKVKALGL